MVADPQSTGALGVVPLLEIRHLTLRYAQTRLLRKANRAVTALEDVSLAVAAGETLAIIGPSGSGKSSLGRCVVLLERPESGEILLEGRDLLKLREAQKKGALRKVQIVFQDSAAALNPGLTIEEVLLEPLVVQRIGGGAERREMVCASLKRVELTQGILSRRTSELSGGQRQRVAIARGLMLKPKLLVLDEALSALDVSTQGQIANLLLDLKECEGLSYLYITHDLEMAAAIADRVVELRAGRIVNGDFGAGGLTGYQQGRAERLPPNSASRETVSGP